MRHDRVQARRRRYPRCASDSSCRRAAHRRLLPWFARGPLLPGTMFEPASLNALHRQRRGGRHRLLDAAVDRDLSRHPPQLGDPSGGADRARHRRRVVPADPLPLRPRRACCRLPAARRLALPALHPCRAEGPAADRRRSVRRDRAASSRSTGVDWHVLKRPQLHDARSCNAIVADFSAELARRMGSVPRRRGARRADRLPGQATVGIADRAGRDRASVGEQLRLAAPGARLFLSQGPARFPVRVAAAAAGAAADGRRRRSRSASTARGPVLFRQKRSAMPAGAIIVYKFRTMRRVEVEDERSAAMTQRRRRPDHARRPCAAQAPDRRAAADHQHPEMGNELDRPASRSAGAVASGTPAKSPSTAIATW